MTPRLHSKSSADHNALYAFLIALPLSLAGTAFLAFLLDAGSRIAM